MNALADLVISTQDVLVGPDGDEHYVLFVNQTEYGNARCLRFRQQAHRTHPTPFRPGSTTPGVRSPTLLVQVYARRSRHGSGPPLPSAAFPH